jgi:hypothetical protein
MANRYPPRALAKALAASNLALTLVSASSQDPGSFYRPLTLASADSPAAEEGASDTSRRAKGQIDFNDPRVMEAVSEALDNPISELLIVWNQFDAVQVHFPGTPLYHERDEWAYVYQFMPVVPVPLGENLTLVSRLDLSVVSLPLKKDAGDLFQLNRVANPYPSGTAATGLDPFGRTTGFGDIAFVSMVGPTHPPEVAGGHLIMGIGPTFIFPSASESILGQGKWQAGPSAGVGFISEHWRLGVFPQQWWSFAGDNQHPPVSQMNLQYFLYYAPTPDWEIGVAPNMYVNWNAPAGNQVTFPVGLGVNHIFTIAQVPVSVGVEVTYPVIHPDDWPRTGWGFRINLILFAPAPWSDLAKKLRALQ